MTIRYDDHTLQTAAYDENETQGSVQVFILALGAALIASMIIAPIVWQVVQ